LVIGALTLGWLANHFSTNREMEGCRRVRVEHTEAAENGRSVHHDNLICIERQ
jgi:hypothetical protein